MAKLTLNNLENASNYNSLVTTINNNNDATETALENTLSRDGTSPNQMQANLDMNSYRITNLSAAASPTDPVRQAEFEAFEGGLADIDTAVAAAEAAQAAAEVAETNAAVSEVNAGLSAIAAETSSASALDSANAASASYAGIRFVYDGSSTSMADPGTGFVRFN